MISKHLLIQISSYQMLKENLPFSRLETVEIKVFQVRERQPISLLESNNNRLQQMFSKINKSNLS